MDAADFWPGGPWWFALLSIQIMKTTIKLLFLAVVAGCCLWACRKTNELREEKQITAEASLASVASEVLTGKQGWIPPGAKAETKNSLMQITAPDGWNYIGTDEKGQTVAFGPMATASITCTCGGTGTCKPFLATGPWGSTTGCNGTCTKCSMSQTTTGTKYSEEINGGGYYQIAATTRLLKNGEHAPAVFDALFQSEHYQKELRQLYDRAYQGRTLQQFIKNDDGSVSAPKGYSLVGALILGRASVVILPSDYVIKELGYITAAKASCSCSNNSGVCKLQDKTILGMGSTWCDGTCNGCTLTTSNLTASNSYEIHIKSFAF